MTLDWGDNGIDAPSLSEHEPTTPPLPGELRAVKTSLGGWGEKARYYSPPIVLVLAVMENSMVQVMQIYDDATMAGDDDVKLGPAIDGFAETWNRYSLKSSDLSFSYGVVPTDVLETCLSSVTNTPKMIEQGSLLWFFRNMEVETGFFFAHQAVRSTMTDIYGWHAAFATLESGAAAPDLSRQALSAVLEQLRNLGLQYRSSDTTDMSLADVLAHTEVAVDQLPLAAAAGDEVLTAIIFNSKRGIFCDYTVCSFVLNHLDLQGTTLLVSGVFADSKPTFDEIICRIKSENKLLPPLPGSFGSQDGVFWAAFSVSNTQKPPKKSELVLRFVRYQ
jgi:hypothetical protein